MASDIAAIYAAIAALSISAGGKTPDVYSRATLKNRQWASNLPCRLLLPMGEFGQGGGGEVRATTFVAITSLTNATWSIRDLCLWRAMNEGLGLQDLAADLEDYTAAYLTAITQNRHLTDSAYFSTSGHTITPGIYQFPINGDWYYGVNCVLSITEIVT